MWIDALAGRLSENAFVRYSVDPEWAGYSAITRLELFGYPDIQDEEEHKLRQLLEEFTEVPVGGAVIDDAIKLRRKEGMKVPDAIIASTARVTNADLVTRNLSDFEGIPDLKCINPHERE